MVLLKVPEYFLRSLGFLIFKKLELELEFWLFYCQKKLDFRFGYLLREER